MDTSLHSRDKRTVKTVGFKRRTGSKGIEDGEIGRQGHYASLLHRLSEEIKKKRPHLKRKKSCSIKTMHGCSFDGQNYGIKIGIIATEGNSLGEGK